MQVIWRVKREDGNYTHTQRCTYFSSSTFSFSSLCLSCYQHPALGVSRRLQHTDAASSRATLKCFPRYFNQLKRQHVSGATVTFASLRRMHTAALRQRQTLTVLSVAANKQPGIDLMQNSNVPTVGVFHGQDVQILASANKKNIPAIVKCGPKSVLFICIRQFALGLQKVLEPFCSLAA